MPSNLRDWLPEHHYERFIVEVDKLDMAINTKC